MKKAAILVILALAIGIIFIGCDQEKALQQILQNEGMKKDLMAQMMSDENIKVEITKAVLADTAWVEEIVLEYSKTMSNRETMMNTLLEYPGMGEILLSKMAEDEDLRNSMKEIGNRRR